MSDSTARRCTGAPANSVSGGNDFQHTTLSRAPATNAAAGEPPVTLVT